jgi:hypothetical protein
MLEGHKGKRKEEKKKKKEREIERKNRRNCRALRESVILSLYKFYK